MKVVTVPTLPPPTIHKEPTLVTGEMPSPIVLTLDDVQPYILACEEYQAVGEEDAYTLDEVRARHPGMTETDACGWATYGLPSASWLNLEAELHGVAAYAEKLRAQLRDAVRQLQDRYRITSESAGEIEEQLQRD